MSNKKKVFYSVCALILLLVNLFVIFRPLNIVDELRFELELKAENAQSIQVYYGVNKALTEEQSQIVAYTNVGENQILDFTVPSNCTVIRLDLGNQQDRFSISKISFFYKNTETDLRTYMDWLTVETNDISQISYSNDDITVLTSGNDPYIWIAVPIQHFYSEIEKTLTRNFWITNIILLLLIDGLALIAFRLRKKIMSLPIELWKNRSLIMNLAKNDFKTKYAGSYLGIVWAFVQPVITVLVYWFVFSVGFKAGEAADYPFVVYLVSGIVPWFFFSDALNGGTNALLEYSYLVKKVVFKISILPMVKVISALFVHVFFVLVALILCACFGYLPGLATLQIVYYMFCTFVFVLGISYATSAIVVFFRDLTQIINIILQVGIWLTPIMWDWNMLSESPLLMKLFRLNPIYYIVSGYRDSLLSHTWFWAHWKWGIYFWGVTAILFVLGTLVFKRLKVHFADIL